MCFLIDDGEFDAVVSGCHPTAIGGGVCVWGGGGDCHLAEGRAGHLSENQAPYVAVTKPIVIVCFSGN